MATYPIYDCIVVGAGIEGSATALALVNRNLKVLLLEQFPLPHTRGSSHGGSRIIRRAYEKVEYTRMMEEAFELWDRLEKLSGEILFRKTGVMIVGPEDGHMLNTFKHSMETSGVKHQLLSSEQLETQFPGLKVPSNYVGLLEPDGGTLKADKCLRVIQNQFQRNGGVLKDCEKLVDVQPGEIITVRTLLNEHRGHKVVLCMGPWTGEFLKTKLKLTLPLQPEVTKVHYWKEKVPGAYSAANGFPCVIFDNDQYHFYALPADEYEGLLKLCSGSVALMSDPDHRDLVDASCCQEKCAQYINQYCPLLANTPSIVESCMYTNTPDDDFVLDRHPVYKNIVIGAGFSGHGFKLAPVVGRILADFVTGEASPYKVEMFAIARFNH